MCSVQESVTALAVERSKVGPHVYGQKKGHAHGFSMVCYYFEYVKYTGVFCRRKAFKKPGIHAYGVLYPLA